jgi:hypothetical protein
MKRLAQLCNESAQIMTEGVIGYRLTTFGTIASESSRVGHDYLSVIESFVLIVVYYPHCAVLSTTGVIALTCTRVSLFPNHTFRELPLSIRRIKGTKFRSTQ